MAEYAVLIPWVTTEYGRALLMEVRSEIVRQPGEVCFPGGRAEEGETAAETAVRETCEELGVSREDIEVTGTMDAVQMGDGRIIRPVVAELRGVDTDALSFSGDEVAEVFLLPLDWLRENDPEYYDLSVTPDEELPAKLRGFLANYGAFRRRGETYYMEYEGRGIWGLTARIIRQIIGTE